MGQQLPPELIDAILEHLIDDKDVLAACCLVCKAWIYPSRRYLFHSVDIKDDATALRFNRLLPSSTTASSILPYIRRLRLLNNFPPSVWNETLSRLLSLENLLSLTITSLPPSWADSPPTSPEAVFSNCHSLVRLHLSRVLFTSFAHLAQLICTFHHLTTLIITRSKWSTPDPPSPAVSPPQSLNALEMLDCNWVTILQWLLSLGHIPSLHTLYVRGRHGYHSGTPTLPRFLQALGPSLRKLRLEPDTIENSEFHINLIHNPCLRALTIQFRKEVLSNSHYLSHLLSEVKSCEMEEIVVRLKFIHKEISAIAWNRVDAILAQPQFARLRAFRICTNHDSASFVDHLPRTYSRGILFIQPRLLDMTIL